MAQALTQQPEQAAARVPVPLDGPLHDLDVAYRYARNLSVSGLMPEALRGKAADILVTILYGQELGLRPMQAVQSIYVVRGRPTISAHLWVALARRAGHRVRVVEETSTSCTVEVIRHDDPDHPTRVTYTLEQAQAAGLTSNDTWRKHRSAMLYARAVSTACRRACPEIALGFGDEVDRLELEANELSLEGGPLARVAAERADQTTPAEAEQTGHGRPVESEIVDDQALADEYARLEAEHQAEQVEPVEEEQR